jgi:hypothetical protein
LRRRLNQSSVTREQPLPGFHLFPRLQQGFVLCAALCLGQAALAATPSFTITAADVSISGQGNATSQFKLTSVNGFAGQVGVTCSDQTTAFLVLPDCANPAVNLQLKANGSATGLINFYPPWTSPASQTDRRSGGPESKLPAILCLLSGAGLVGLRKRLKLNRALVLGAGFLGLTACATGCGGHGGLAMTPGTYTYTLTAFSSLGPTATTTISVKVKCDSCP